MLDENQQKAIDINSSVWVGASAGTGKTKLLTDRVISLLLNKTEPNKILCITFTKAAAAEMQIRITKELGDWVFLKEEDLIKRLIELNVAATKANIDFARSLYFSLQERQYGIKIQTIHSFCQNILEKFPTEAGLQFGFKLIEDNEAKQVLIRIKNKLQDLLSSNRNLKQEYIESLENLFASLNNEKFQEILENIIDNTERFNELFKLKNIEELIKSLCLELNISETHKESDIIESVNDLIKREKFSYIASNPANSDKKRDIETASSMQNIVTCNNNYIIYKILLSMFLTKDYQPRKQLYTNIIKNNFPDIADSLNELQDNVISIYNKLRKLKIVKYTKETLYIAHLVVLEYQKYKNYYNLIDYNDLIYYTDYLLSKEEISPWILFKLEGGIEHLLLDEAQDTSLSQWRVISRFAEEFFTNYYERNKTLLVVGDDKQSIYSFQGANSLIFSYMKKRYIETAKFNNVPLKEVELYKSFRSSPCILDFVNDIFTKEKYKYAVSNLGIFNKHIAFKENNYGKIEVWELEPDENKKDNYIIADKIAKYISTQITNNMATAGDFLILVRRRNELVNLILSALLKFDIPVAGLDRIKLMENLVIKDLIAIGKFVLNPHDNFNLLILLRSPLFNMEYDNINKLILNKENKISLWDIIKTSEDYIFLYNKLNNFINLYYNYSFYEFYLLISKDKNFLAHYCSILGNEVFELISEFLDLIYKFYHNKGGCLLDCLNYFSNLKIEIKRELENNNEAVRIMTVHGSKGLQAKQTILADTISESKLNDIFFFQGDEENSACYIYLNKEFEYEKLSYLRNNKKQELEDEYLRLLYVALTRAEESLIICGFKEENKEKENWYNICKNSIKTFTKEAELDPELEINVWRYETNIINRKNSINYPIVEYEIKEELTKEYENLDNNEDINTASEKANNTNKNALIMGEVSHKLLQLIPKFSKNNFFDFSQKISAQFADLEDIHKNDIIDNTILLLTNKELNWLFQGNYSSELPICGYIDKTKNQFYSVRLDHICEFNNERYIIDFKTDINVPENKEAIEDKYKKQLDIYRKLIQKIYPKQKIHCGLLYLQKQVIFWL